MMILRQVTFFYGRMQAVWDLKCWDLMYNDRYYKFSVDRGGGCRFGMGAVIRRRSWSCRKKLICFE